MNALLQKVNGHGSPNGDVSGRGLRHRVFDSHHDRLEEAADIATGARRYVPTLAETATAYGLSIAEFRTHLKARAARLQAAAELRAERDKRHATHTDKRYQRLVE